MSSREKSKVYYADFGCRLNQFETRVLQNKAHEDIITTENREDADFIVINTCTVTNRADTKNRQAIRKARQLNPNARIIVTGCYATTDADELKAMPEVDSVISNKDKFTIPQIIAGYQERSTHSQYQASVFPFSEQTLKQGSRAYLKIQDGCNQVCSYCKIPAARGKAVSRKISENIQEVETLVKAGFCEIVLTGVNIGHYRHDGKKLNDLLIELSNIPGDHYYRISSIEPDCVNDELLATLSGIKFARFLHIPVQSGSNKILKLMKRRYTTEQFRELVLDISRKIPDMHIGTDIIVGFPGETENDFQETLDLVYDIPFSNIHIFPFSKRSGTDIDKSMKLQEKKTALSAIHTDGLFEVPGDIIRKRIDVLSKIQEQNKTVYVNKTSGRIFRAIVEKVNDAEIHFVTENYIKGKMPMKFIHNMHFSKGDKIRIRYNQQMEFSISQD